MIKYNWLLIIFAFLIIPLAAKSGTQEEMVRIFLKNGNTVDYKVNESGEKLYDQVGIFRNDNNFLNNLNDYLDGKMYEGSSNAFQKLYRHYYK